MINRFNLSIFFGIVWVLVCSIIWFLSPFIVIAIFLWGV